jgi:hypothetical protein
MNDPVDSCDDPQPRSGPVQTEHERTVAALCNQLDVSRFPAPLQVRATAHRGILYIAVSMRNLVERDLQCESWSQVFSDSAPVHATAQDALDWVRSVIRRAILHELDECLLLDGKRPWDPHIDGRREF